MFIRTGSRVILTAICGSYQEESIIAGIKRAPGEDINHFFNRLPKGAGEAIGNAGGGEQLARDMIRRQYYKEPDGVSEVRRFSYADAVEKSCSILKTFYTCAEYPDAWLFSDKLDVLGGGEVAVVIEKSTRRRLLSFGLFRRLSHTRPGHPARRIPGGIGWKSP
ncbi:MAG: hypothetical protein MJ085_04635 [Clostridia bacterium]|nr:hypothetical protein [Clostridia bacterium]